MTILELDIGIWKDCNTDQICVIVEKNTLGFRTGLLVCSLSIKLAFFPIPHCGHLVQDLKDPSPSKENECDFYFL